MGRLRWGLKGCDKSKQCKRCSHVAGTRCAGSHLGTAVQAANPGHGAARRGARGLCKLPHAFTATSCTVRLSSTHAASPRASVAQGIMSPASPGPPPGTGPAAAAATRVSRSARGAKRARDVLLLASPRRGRRPARGSMHCCALQGAGPAAHCKPCPATRPPSQRERCLLHTYTYGATCRPRGTEQGRSGWVPI